MVSCSVTPGRLSRRIGACDSSGDDALSQIGAAEVKVSPDAAKFTGLIKTRDRLGEGIENALFRIVDGTALRIADERPDFADIEGWFAHLHQASCRTAEILVVPGFNRGIPAAQR